jgi:hypothetical protein
MTEPRDKHFTEEAQKAVEHLAPYLDKALEVERENLERANQSLSREEEELCLVKILNEVETPPIESIIATLGNYAGLLPKEKTRDGKLFIRSLVSIKKYHGLTDEQAGQVARSIIGSIHNKATVTLVQWPDADTWHSALAYSDLRQWCEWVAPKEYGKLRKRLDSHLRALIAAEKNILNLETSKRALEQLGIHAVSCDGKKIKIRNNGDLKQGVAGLRWEPGETLTLAPETYGEMIHHAGFAGLVEMGQMEVVA